VAEDLRPHEGEQKWPGERYYRQRLVNKQTIWQSNPKAALKTFEEDNYRRVVWSSKSAYGPGHFTKSRCD